MTIISRIFETLQWILHPPASDISLLPFCDFSAHSINAWIFQLSTLFVEIVGFDCFFMFWDCWFYFYFFECSECNLPIFWFSRFGYITINFLTRRNLSTALSLNDDFHDAICSSPPSSHSSFRCDIPATWSLNTWTTNGIYTQQCLPAIASQPRDSTWSHRWLIIHHFCNFPHIGHSFGCFLFWILNAYILPYIVE